MASKKIVLDLFSGAGGLSEGFLQNDTHIIAHIEMNDYAAQTLETRTFYHALAKKGMTDLYFDYYNQKITRNEFIGECKSCGIPEPEIITREISENTERAIIEKIQSRLDECNRHDVDIMIGGPPCQAYSLIGRGRDLNSMQDDPRNHLYIHYLHFLNEFKPDIFIFENVPGLISARNGEIYRNFLKHIDELGYISPSGPRILNAQHFGVLQNRNRIIFIGWKKELDLEYPSFKLYRLKYKVWNVLNDLPCLEPGEGTDGPQPYRVGRPSNYLKEFNIRNGQKYIRHHSARIHNERDREIYRIAIKLWTEERERLRYNNLPENLKTHSNQSSFLDRFKVVDGEGCSHAVVAHLSKDGHYYIHPDERQIRSLTVREAARLQSFPDDYLFEGSRSAQYVQIGNAVPPLMAKGIAKEIVKMLN